MPPIISGAVLDQLFPPFPELEETRAFALLDAARNDAIYPALLRADCHWECLYRGDAAATMAEVAPYLVHLDPAARFTPWLLEHAWGDSWCVFLTTAAKFDVLRSHFRRFLMVEMPNGKMVYFRFYDPRVLRAYLPTCTPEELEQLFGPVEQFVVEEEDGHAASAFRRGPEGLIRQRLE